MTATIDFAMTLKEIQVITHGHSKHQQTGAVVTCIVSTRFMQFCDITSPNYGPSHLNYDKFTCDLLQRDDVDKLRLSSQSNAHAQKISWFHGLL